jgi:FMN reductase
MLDTSLSPAVSVRADGDPRPLIVGLGGTFRERSSTEKVLKISMDSAERLGARVVSFLAGKLNLPLYNPESTERSRECAQLIDLLERCDGLIIASPSYHGSISGMIKNALDYAEDMAARGVPYLDGKAVGCISCGAGWQGAVGALHTLRTIVHSLRAWPTPLGIAVNTAEAFLKPNGEISDNRLFEQLELVGKQVYDFAVVNRSRIQRNLI